MALQDIKDYLAEDWTAVMRIITDSLHSDIDLLDRTNRSILSSSGKQLRPVISLLLARAFSKDGKANHDSHLFAASCELLHNATLLHDDVADDSPRRRGKPTVQSILGPSASVLIGDFWLVRAVDCILSASRHTNEVICNFACTLRALAEGEMLQLQKASSGDTTFGDYLRIINCKTASLFRTSAYTAAVSVDVDGEQMDRICAYGENMGIAFQIKDDIFDYTPNAQVGKPVGADILEGKITLPLLGAFHSAGPLREKEIRSMVTDIRNHPENRDIIAGFVSDNCGIEYAYEKMDSYLDRAVDSLSSLEESREKDYLLQLASYVRNRKI